MFPFPHHHHHHLPSSSSSYNISNNPQETNEHNIYLYHHHHHHPHPNNLNPFTIPFLSSNNLNHPQISHQPAELNIASTSTNPINIPNHHHHFDPAAPTSFLLPTTKRSPAAAAVKKDRHSKIYTAQGLRDRRVRLSIEIARKFFDLQDMLGFDKASKTLDWLLTKSKKAIKELAQNGCAKSSTNFSSPSSNYNDNCGDDDEDDDDQENVDDEVDGRLLGTVPSHHELKRMKKLQKSGSAVNDLVAKESRAKARERARERTRMKMCTRSRSSCPNPNPNHNHHHHHHALKIFGQEGNNENESKGKNIVDEPTVIKRKMKPSTTTTMAGPSASNNCLSNLVQNWDINSSFARSSFCASANMNLSTELQLYGNLWEPTENNQCQH